MRLRKKEDALEKLKNIQAEKKPKQDEVFYFGK